MAWYDNLNLNSLLGTTQSAELAKTLFPDQAQAIQDRSIQGGLLGGLASYLKAPKNQNRGYGALIGDVLGGVQTGAQSSYDTNMANYLTKEKIQGMQKNKAESEAFDRIMKESGNKFDKNKLQEMINSGNIEGAQKYVTLFSGVKNIEATKEGKTSYRQLTPDEVLKRGLNTNLVYQIGSDNQVAPIGGQADKTPRTVSKEDVNIAGKILTDLGGKDLGSYAGVVAAEANKKVSQSGMSFSEAVQSTVNDLNRTGAIKNMQKTFLGLPLAGTSFKEIDPAKLYGQPLPAPATQVDVAAKRQPISEADYNKLPKGATYTDPSGNVRVKK